MTPLMRYLIGDTVTISTVVAGEPQLAPTVLITRADGSTVVSGVRMGKVNSPSLAFKLDVLLDDGYVPGVYHALVRYVVSTIENIEETQFTVVGGGDSRGTTTSMRSVQRTGGQWVISHSNNGDVTSGYRPY